MPGYIPIARRRDMARRGWIARKAREYRRAKAQVLIDDLRSLLQIHIDNGLDALAINWVLENTRIIEPENGQP